MEHYEGTATLKLINKLEELYKATNDPADTDIPYLFITNDLCRKVLLALSEAKMTITNDDIVYLLDLLMETYNDPPAPMCCAFWHSNSREKMEEVKGQILAVLPKN